MALIIKDLAYRYPSNDEDTLNGVSLKVNNGEIITLLGPNGCGKTTLIKSLLGHLKASGQVELDEQNLKSMKWGERNKIISYLTQEQPLPSSLSVFEVILLGNVGSLGIKPSKKMLEHTAHIIEQFGLTEIGNKKYSELSGGQQRIVNIAQVMAKNPKILILDEPTANLDISNEFEVLELVKHYVKQKNIICIMVLHSISMAARYSDRICLLKDGKIYREGSPIDIITEENILDTYHVIVEKNVTRDGHPTVNLVGSKNKKEYNFKDGNER